MRSGDRAHRKEGVSAFGEVQGTEHNARLALLVALGPALGEELPLGLELVAQLAAVAVVHGSQEDGHGVVAGDGGQLLVGTILELQGRGRQGLGMEFVELAGGRGLLGGHSPEGQGQGEQQRCPAHGDGWQEQWWAKRRWGGNWRGGAGSAHGETPLRSRSKLCAESRHCYMGHSAGGEYRSSRWPFTRPRWSSVTPTVLKVQGSLSWAGPCGGWIT